MYPITHTLDQVSWKESHEKAATGKRPIKFFDDERTAAIKKVCTLIVCAVIIVHVLQYVCTDEWLLALCNIVFTVIC